MLILLDLNTYIVLPLGNIVKSKVPLEKYENSSKIKVELKTAKILLERRCRTLKRINKKYKSNCRNSRKSRGKQKCNNRANELHHPHFEMSSRIKRRNDPSNRPRTSLRSLLNHQVVYTGTLFEIRVNRWRAHYANVLLKPVTIAGKDYDHIWIKISLKRLLKWMPYLIEVVDTDARYYTYKVAQAISTQHPRVISHIMQIASPRNERLSMYDLEHMNDEPEDLDVQINVCTISGNAKVVQYYRNPKNKLIHHDVNDGFTFDYGILANSADLDVDTTPLVTDE